MATLEASEEGEAQLAAAYIKGFLERTTRAQVTPYGVKCLTEEVPDRQICILYRGGRFHAAFRREDKFYLLCNDPQLVGDASVVWEQLLPNGATNFANSQFHLSENVREAEPAKPLPELAPPKVRPAGLAALCASDAVC